MRTEECRQLLGKGKDMTEGREEGAERSSVLVTRVSIWDISKPTERLVR